MSDTILSTIRKLLGMEDDYTYFDNDILIHVNTAVSILSQLGIENIRVTEETTWEDLLKNENAFELVKDYIFLFTRKIFDPPANSFVVDSYEKTLKELEWRIVVATEHKEGESNV